MTTKHLRRRTVLFLIFVLAIFIMFESWQATAHAAAEGGRPSPKVWPVVLEGLLAVLVLVYWDVRSGGRKGAWIAQATAWIITAVASWVQVLDAPPTWKGWITAASTPVALLLAVEFGLWMMHGGVRAADPGPAPGPAPARVAILAATAGDPAARALSSKDLAVYLDKEHGITASPSYVRKIMAESRNGSRS